MYVTQKFHSTHWDHAFSSAEQSLALGAIEQGKILHFSELPFVLLPHEHEFLTPAYAHPKSKNISFNYLTNMLHGTVCSPLQHEKIKQMMQRFVSHATTLVKQLLQFYTPALKIGRTSFRPIEISGRASSYRKDDTRLHVDAFPSSPNHGHRILRVFTNINPHGHARVWRVGEAFADVAARFLPQIRRPFVGKSTLLKALKITKQYRSEYDHIMLQIHDRMKADVNYQVQAKQTELHFATNSTWIVQTDHVSHAAMAGQYMLEQTFYLPVHAMQNPQLSPLQILEKMTGRSLVKKDKQA